MQVGENDVIMVRSETRQNGAIRQRVRMNEDVLRCEVILVIDESYTKIPSLFLTNIGYL